MRGKRLREALAVAPYTRLRCRPCRGRTVQHSAPCSRHRPRTCRRVVTLVIVRCGGEVARPERA